MRTPDAGALALTTDMMNPLRDVAAVPLRAVAEAPARLHLGFLDPSATLGRRFASLGVVIDGFSSCIELLPASANEVDSYVPGSDRLCDRIGRQLARLQGETGAGHPLRVVLHSAPPAHAGFGSGTQLALALGGAFAGAHGIALGPRQIATLLGRGERSGVGIAGFERGGLLLDGGPGSEDRPAPLLARADFPEAWRVILVIDDDADGLHGEAEREAMSALPAFPRESAAELCHLTVMKVLPSAIEQRFEPFAEGITTIQRRIGDYFAPAQGGSMYTSPRVGTAIEWIAAHCTAGIGQSSWGPTGFAVVASAGEANEVVQAARDAGVIDEGLRVCVVSGRNRGGAVRRARQAMARS